MNIQETQPKVEVDASIMNFFGPNTIYTIKHHKRMINTIKNIFY